MSLRTIRLIAFAIIYSLATWLYALVFAKAGLIKPGWTDSAWYESIYYYYTMFSFLAIAVVFSVFCVVF